MAAVLTIPIATKSGSYYAPVEAGNYYLRVSPFSSNTYTGTHLGSGVWSFGAVNDGWYQLWDASAQVASYGEFYVMDSTPTLTLLTMAGNIVMGGNILTGLGAGASAGQSVRWEQVAKLAVNELITGYWYFNTNCPASSIAPSSGVHLTNKDYVDGLYGGVSSPVLSSYEIQLVTSRTADSYSKTTLEDCNSFLAAKANITSYRGSITIHPTVAANNGITVDASGTAWCSNGVDIFSPNKARITRGANNSSITSTSRLWNVHLYDNNVIASRAYTNFTFQDCDFSLLNTEITFTSCIFRGKNRIYSDSEAINLTNCSGDGDISSNGTFTLSGTSPTGDLKDGLDLNDLGTPA